MDRLKNGLRNGFSLHREAGRGYNIVADGRVGAYNPFSHPQPTPHPHPNPTGIQWLKNRPLPHPLYTQRQSQMRVFALFKSSVTVGPTKIFAAYGQNFSCTSNLRMNFPFYDVAFLDGCHLVKERER